MLDSRVTPLLMSRSKRPSSLSQTRMQYLVAVVIRSPCSEYFVPTSTTHW